jgi:tetratricopeptide (TPR) repeat protein
MYKNLHKLCSNVSFLRTMRYFLVAVFFLICILSGGKIVAQATHFVTDDEAKYKTVKEHIAKEEYALAYPLVKDLLMQYPATQKANNTYVFDDVQYFQALCELKLQLEIGKENALAFINHSNNDPRKAMLSFHIGHYYFLQGNYGSAIVYFDEADIANLSNEQIADAKFEKAYSYFQLKQYANAKPLFDEIRQIEKNKYYLPATYYYGFINYYNKQYSQALESFLLVANVEEYKTVVPYYIAEIYYFQGKKDEALNYAEKLLAEGGMPNFNSQLNLLTGQIYFEKGQYKKALPLLENYVNATSKVTQQIQYELSYCYYVAGQNDKAIAGFKQLSNLKDSMGQNSMYLLGDLYLKAGQRENARNAFQYCAYNSSNKTQQKVSRFNYAKLSYELGYQDIALNEIKTYLNDYPKSEYDAEAKEILVQLLARTSNYVDALALYEKLEKPTAAMQKLYPTIAFGRAIELFNDQRVADADALFTKVIADANAGNLAGYAKFWRGEIAYRNQNYDEAIRNLSDFVATGLPALGEANVTTAKYNLGYCNLQKQNFKTAQSYFEGIAPSISTTSTAFVHDAYIRAADAVFMQKDFTKAAAMYDNAINAVSPQSDYAYFQKATIVGIKNPIEKINTLKKLQQQYPNSYLKDEVNLEIAQTFISTEKYNDAVPFLNNVIKGSNNALKPQAYLKLGLAYYNAKNNKEAISTYTALMKAYPQSAEADEAVDIVKALYVEEGNSDEFVALMNSIGKPVAITEADSLSYTIALNKYQANDCAGAITAFNNYLSKFPAGAYTLEANYLTAECNAKANALAKALPYYVAVSEKGPSKYFERSTLEAARIYYFESKDYVNAKKYFQLVRDNAANQDNILEALRGLVRCAYQTKDYTGANTAANDLLKRKGISTDDKAVALLTLGKSQQIAGDCNEAIKSFKQVAAINKAAWGAEARYENAACQLSLNNLTAAEKAALQTIKETGSYDEWVTKSYILLGDVFMQQKDYFNAKATYESVAKNASIEAIKQEAETKLQKAIAAEAAESKIINN